MVTRPTLSPVKALDLRSINNALGLLRDQLYQVALTAENAQQIAGQNSFAGSMGATTLGQLQQQVLALQQQLAALVAGGEGPTATYRADAAITSSDVVFQSSDGGVSPVDTQDPTQIFAAIGIATSSAAVNANLTVRRSGILTGVGNGWERGRAVYAEIGSGLTQWPNYAAVALPVGVAINATDLAVRTAWPAVREKPLYGGGYEDFMPVTLQLVRYTLELVDSLAGQPDGFVVKVDGVLSTRVLIAGSGAGIVIDNPDGSTGDPSFRLG